MTKEERNQIIKDAWVRNLQKKTDIPEDIGETYKLWLRGLIEQATNQLKSEQAQTAQSEQQPFGQQSQELQNNTQGQEQTEQEQEAS